MTEDEAFEELVTDYYTDKENVQKLEHKPREINLMTLEQIKQLSKKEMNTVITKFTGGYTTGNLANITKDDLAQELFDELQKAQTKPKTVKKSSNSKAAKEERTFLLKDQLELYANVSDIRVKGNAIWFKYNGKAMIASSPKPEAIRYVINSIAQELTSEEFTEKFLDSQAPKPDPKVPEADSKEVKE